MATILVVDDRPANREFLVTLLGYRQHRLFEAGDGAEALAMVRAHRPDLVITDILMPTMDGYEFVRQLRADPAIAATAVIFHTAHYHRHEADAIAKSCGVRHILSKPGEPEEILRVVGDALATPESQVELPPPAEFDQQHLRIVTDKLSETVDDLRISSQRMAALVDINLRLASERDPRQLLASVCGMARDLFGAKHALLAVGNRDNGHDVHCTSSGMDAATAARLALPALRAGAIGVAYAERSTLRLANPSGDPQAVGLPAGHPPAHALLVAPIVSLAHVYGWICLSDKLGALEFSAEDERLLGILAAQVGRIFENGSLYVEVRRHAVRLEAEIEQRKQIQDALTRSEGRFRQLAENIHQVFWLTDAASHQLLYVSPAYEQIWGRSCEGIYAAPDDWLEAIHPDDRARVADAVPRQVHGGYIEEYRIVRPDGTLRWIRDRAFPVRDADGAVGRIAGIAEDITESRRATDRLRESERRFSDMLGNVELISIMLDRNARLTYCNDSLLRLTGWKREEVLDRDWFHMFLPPEPDMHGLFAELLVESPTAWHHENAIRTRDGAQRMIRWNNSVLRSPDGEVIGTASIGEDITERRKAEQVLAERVNELETFHRLSVGREMQMIALKKQINAMAAQAGQAPPYDLAFLDIDPHKADPRP